jgi:hypothetical protein
LRGQRQGGIDDGGLGLLAFERSAGWGGGTAAGGNGHVKK